MWVWIEKFLIGLVRWFIINCILKPLVERTIVRPLSEMLLGGATVDGVFEDAMEADAELGGAPVDGVVEGAVEENAEREADDFI